MGREQPSAANLTFDLAARNEKAEQFLAGFARFMGTSETMAHKQNS